VPPDDSIEQLRPYLLPLEAGTITSVRDGQLRLRMTSYTPASGPLAEDDVDLVLLACATAILQEGSESAAAILAREELGRHPERVELVGLATEDAEASDEELRAFGERYLRSAGYDLDPISGSFRAVGDIYLGRVHRSITHPVVGVACVAYFGVARNHPRVAAEASRCHSLWSDWLNRRRPLEDIEREAMTLAREWASSSPPEHNS